MNVVPALAERMRYPSFAHAVLVVSEDAAVRARIGAMVESLGHRALRAGGSAQAMSIVQQGEPVRLLIVDLLSAGLNGIVLAARLGLSAPGLAVLFATASSPEEVLELIGVPLEVLELGMADEALRGRIAEELDG